MTSISEDNDRETQNKEQLVKQLIGICVKKCFEKQMTELSLNFNIFDELKRLRDESTARVTTFASTRPNTASKETQVNTSSRGLSEGSWNDYSLKVTTHTTHTTQLCNGSAVKSLHTPVIKQSRDLMTNGVKQCVTNGLPPKLNGFDKHLVNNCLDAKKSVKSETLVTNGAIHKTSGVLGVSCGAKRNHMNTLSTKCVEPEVVTIDSDDSDGDHDCEPESKIAKH